MSARDYVGAPVSDRLNLEEIIQGLAGDLKALRAGDISVGDAQARAMLAKQIFNGVRIYLNGISILSGAAKEAKRELS
jgi:hypothetical protein